MASVLSDKRFWQAASEKVVMTFSQTLAAELVVFSVPELRDIGLKGLPWTAMLTLAVIAAAVSLLSSVSKGSVGIIGPGTQLEDKGGSGGGRANDKEDGGTDAKVKAV